MRINMASCRRKRAARGQLMASRHAVGQLTFGGDGASSTRGVEARVPLANACRPCPRSCVPYASTHAAESEGKMPAVYTLAEGRDGLRLQIGSLPVGQELNQTLLMSLPPALS